ncbi:hypothetical protein [Ancylobacter defluvii]|uniref:Uncharacterized protein n=1 Tax=Ancylobacter defluvii TaxID=1282440 RepID=A0A9W6JRQ8_9HYPH|nr:hypothetical protein [Ancylobacter defluvii]MBS7587736.1 hypothetical protein [Ancylobacter defluvii]GLK82546.1 hypothetical protein GCM10017653_06150 [Ancylobacter defluvii]
MLPFDAFRPQSLTFTCPDSVASLLIVTRQELAFHRKPYLGQVFTLAEPREVVARFGLPGARRMIPPWP